MGVSECFICVLSCSYDVCVHVYVCIAEVDLVFDDGVEYTAPVIHVRKRVRQ